MRTRRGNSRSFAGFAAGAKSGGKGIILFALFVMTLTAIAIYALRQFGGNGAEHIGTAPGGTGTTKSAAFDSVSEGRIIFGGMPRARAAGIQFTALRNKAYIVGYSEERRDPLWSAYRVIRVEGEVHEDRPKGNFLTDERTRARVTHNDFTGSGYDRGHMTPNFAIGTRYGPEAQLETFLLSNICPQAPALNQKVWEHLEKMEIDYSNQLGEVWVVDGPVFGDLNGGTTSKLRSGVSVPSAFYKIVVEAHAGTPRVFSVIMPQTVKGTESPRQFLTSVGEIEKETGLEFLWTLDAATQKGLKEKVWAMW